MATTREILISLGIDDSKIVLAEKKLSTSFKKAKGDAIAFQKELNKVGDAVDSLVPSFGQIGLFVGGLAAAFLKLKGYTDGIKDIVDQTKISAETIQEINYAAGQLGANTDAIAKSYETFYKNISTGSKDARKAITTLKLETKLAGKTIDEQYNIIIERLADMEDPVARNTAAFELFGKSAGKMSPLFAEGAEGLRKLRAEAVDSGAVIGTNVINKFDELSDKWNSISSRITTTLVNAVVDSGLLNEIEQLTVQTANWLSTIDGKKLASFLSVVFDVVKALVILRAALFGMFVANTLINGITAVVGAFGKLNAMLKATNVLSTAIGGGLLGVIAKVGLAVAGALAANAAINKITGKEEKTPKKIGKLISTQTATGTQYSNYEHGGNYEEGGYSGGGGGGARKKLTNKTEEQFNSDYQKKQDIFNSQGDPEAEAKAQAKSDRALARQEDTQVKELESLKKHNKEKEFLALTEEWQIEALIDHRSQLLIERKEKEKLLEQATADKKKEIAEQLSLDLEIIDEKLIQKDLEISEKKIANAKKVADDKMKYENQVLTTTASVGQSIIDIASSGYKKGSKQAKRAQKAGLAMKLLTEPYQAYTAAVTNTLIPAPASAVMAGIQAALVAYKIKQAISDVDKAPSLASGGIIQGSGSPTQDNIRANLSAGEQVVSVADKDSFNAKLQSVLDKDISINLTLDSKIIAREIITLQSTIRN